MIAALTRIAGGLPLLATLAVAGRQTVPTVPPRSADVTPAAIDTSWPPDDPGNTASWSNAGWDPTEARQLLEFCIDLNDADDDQPPVIDAGKWESVFPPSDGPVPPNGKKVSIGPFNNWWRLWKLKDAKVYAIAVRGTIGTMGSILDDVIATSIPAQAVIPIDDGHHLAFTLARTPRAELHLGFTYALASLMFDRDRGILKALRDHVPKGAKIVITGHSQGAAVATLVHAFLHYALNDPDEAARFLGIEEFDKTTPYYRLKSYVFAQPKPGNWQFSMDFARIAAARDGAFTINNDVDWVPQVPLAVEFIDEPGADMIAHLEEKENPVKLALTRLLIKGSLGLVRTTRTSLAVTSEKTTVRKFLEKNALDPAYFLPGAADLNTDDAVSINYALAGNLMPVFGSDAGVALTEDGALTEHHATNYRILFDRLYPTPSPAQLQGGPSEIKAAAP